MFDRERLLSHLSDPEERELGSRVIDLAEQVYRNNDPRFTDFLDPRGVDIAVGILRGIQGLAYFSSGGYREAERRILAIYPDYYLTEILELPLQCLQAEGDFSFEAVSHRDFLGSLLASGIKRSKVGDILLTDTGCQVVVVKDVADYIQNHWQAVHRVPIRVFPIEPEQLAVGSERVKEIRTTVASLRLDAIAGAGFGTSRTKMAKEIKAERVKVNWQSVTNPSASVAQGDVISIRGRGRVEIAEVMGTTRKGRISVLLKRFI
ncbi:MAG: photosystem II S4 domain protein [Firmicutes bacterium]|nr:photosystem II S4 domain protein [Bacillota bacterium]